MPRPESSERYWRTNIRLITAGLLLGFVATFGLPFFARDLSWRFIGWPFGFWVTAQGALLIYLLIVSGYAWIMNRLDDRLPGADGNPRA